MNLLIGVTGSSGVIDLPLYFRVFAQEMDVSIRIVVTETVCNFINIDFLKTFVHGEVYESLYKGTNGVNVPHSDLVEWADVFVVMPCTANTLSKAAHGISDNLLMMLILCFPTPVIFCPNMNPNMWKKPTIQRNAELLIRDGHRVIQPTGNGWITATGQAVESGHMPPPYALAEYISKFYQGIEGR